MYIYYVVLLAAVAGLIVYFQKDRKIDSVAFYGLAVVICVLPALRMDSEIDYVGYAEMFDDTPKLGDFNVFSTSTLYGENGYLLFNSIIKTFGGTIHAVILICAIISVWLKVHVIKKLAIFRSISLTLFLCLHFITIEFIQMRWAVACGFIAMGLYLLQGRRIWPALACLVAATGFHYYSLIFVAVGVVALMGGYWRYFVMLVLAVIWALVVRGDLLRYFIVDQSEVYVVKRYASYVADPQSKLGAFSFIKLGIYPIIYLLCHFFNATFCRRDVNNLFLMRVAFTSIALTLVVSSVPMFHYRAVVIADLFSIMLVINATFRTLPAPLRMIIVSFLCAGYCAWYVLDVRNYENAGRLFPYQTWLR